ncbi:FAD synthase-like isoform X2 [Eupeodes corollae]|nr:FAD synthase-like isoform X2 [Eupeodes corollae]
MQPIILQMMNADGTNSNGSRNSSNGCSLNAKTVQAFELFNQLFQNYSPDEVFVSFNGGKDCTVVLHLLSQYLKQKENLQNCVINVLYIRPENPFQEVEDFVAQCKQNYRVDMIEQQGSIKPVLEVMCAERPKLKAVLMGIRRTDPYGHDMKPMQQTDSGWPPLLRVNPILDWTCQDIWTYLLEKKVPYCSLYDMGYTSLGETTNTKRNKQLRREDPATGEVTYRPAYELLDDALERDGRC